MDIYFRINYNLFSSKKIWYTLKQINNNTGSSFLYLKPEILKENK